MKDIPGYEGLYAATENGQIWSYRRNRFMTLTPKPNQPYLICGLTKDGSTHTYHVHALICMTYKPMPAPNLTIDHLDEDGTNNSVDNLEWVSIEENNRRRATHHYTIAIECVETGQIWWTHEEAARDLNVDRSTVSNHLRGRTKTITKDKLHLRKVDVASLDS